MLKSISIFLAILTLQLSTASENFSYRKYSHVKSFYERIAPIAIELGVEHNIPPAAILAISGVESGYGRGYVAKITGNILSLGAWRGERELPALKMPVVKKSREVIVDRAKLKKLKPSRWKYEKRPPSLKKDYRPLNIAGTNAELDYFLYHKEDRARAHKKNIEDFVKKWISLNSTIKAFREAKKQMNAIVEKDGKKALFNKKAVKQFVYAIGGKKNSFNYRESWPKKVMTISRKAGLVSLTEKMHMQKLTFKETW